jgi:hypothetical protein
VTEKSRQARLTPPIATTRPKQSRDSNGGEEHRSTSQRPPARPIRDGEHGGGSGTRPEDAFRGLAYPPRNNENSGDNQQHCNREFRPNRIGWTRISLLRLNLR